MSALFEGPAPRVLATPAGAPFLDLIADAMADALHRKDDPFALSDALVLAANRRAAQGLMEAFARRLGGAALLPTIRPLGDPAPDDDPDVWGAHALELETAPAMAPARQRLELASLIRARDHARGGTEDPARALALADELVKLLQSAATSERVDWGKLSTLVEDGALARHWEQSAAFLSIIADFWPRRLAEAGLADPGAAGAGLLRALAAEWTRAPPQRAIIIAGSTGSVAATRALMAAVARLPRGAVVLPGLDADLDDEAWGLVGEQHPQFALKQTLEALGVDRRAVRQLGGEVSRARAVLIREALAPAEKTADWLERLKAAGGAAFVAQGAEGLRLAETATEDEEAGVIALLLREALETPGRTAALVTPDASLARRVEAKLARWGVAAAVSHPAPLRETEAGVLVALICELAGDPGAPVALAALLKHPRVRRDDDGAALGALEHQGLRGARRHDTLEALEALLSPGPRALIARVRTALAPLSTAMAQESLTLDVFADAAAHAIDNLAAAPWRGRDGARAAEMLREAIAHGQALGPMPARAAPRVLMRLMHAREVPPERGGDARIAIWGPMEARLQRRDLMILGGLNEGVWPAPAGEDPFLSRPMRARLGLPSLEQRIGLAAHDFSQFACAPQVVFTRALRREGAPTLASRWLWRLKTLALGAGAALARADEAIGWAQALDAPPAVREPKVPKPRPPVGSRLTRISVTQVETLIRDPYAVYARRILGLEHRRPIGAPAGPAERGTAIHKAIERFEDGDDPALLLALLDEEFSRVGVSAEQRAGERHLLAEAAHEFAAFVKARRARGGAIYREHGAHYLLDKVGVTLTAKADHIEIGAGHAAIIDFKSGAPPSPNEVNSGLAPQLPLEAALLARGAFEGLPAAKASELIYWRFSAGKNEEGALAVEGDAHEAGERALARLIALLAQYGKAEQAFLSKPRVKFIKPYDEYDHLARRKEWADANGDEA